MSFCTIGSLGIGISSSTLEHNSKVELDVAFTDIPESSSWSFFHELPIRQPTALPLSYRGMYSVFNYPTTIVAIILERVE